MLSIDECFPHKRRYLLFPFYYTKDFWTPNEDDTVLIICIWIPVCLLLRDYRCKHPYLSQKRNACPHHHYVRLRSVGNVQSWMQRIQARFTAKCVQRMPTIFNFSPVPHWHLAILRKVRSYRWIWHPSSATSFLLPGLESFRQAMRKFSLGTNWTTRSTLPPLGINQSDILENLKDKRGFG